MFEQSHAITLTEATPYMHPHEALKQDIVVAVPPNCVQIIQPLDCKYCGGYYMCMNEDSRELWWCNPGKYIWRRSYSCVDDRMNLLDMNSCIILKKNVYGRNCIKPGSPEAEEAIANGDCLTVTIVEHASEYILK